MGEARRRNQEGLPPKYKKGKQTPSDFSQRSIPWLPITEKQRIQFYEVTTRAGWIGIGILALIWVVVRFIGPAAGWWVPADIH